MILEEWNTEDAIAFAREEGREEGREQGLEEGIERGREEIFNLLSQRLPKEEIEEIKSRLSKTADN